MRDHRKLRAFELADSLVKSVYRATRSFPTVEKFGLTIQLRRAAVSIPSNIVEGCARSSEADFARFIDISQSSARELQYQVTLAADLGYLEAESAVRLIELCDETNRVISGLHKALKH